MSFSRLLLLITSCSSVWFATCLSNLPTSRPHVILIVADDLGWNDVSFHGSNQIPTPNIDVLATDGISLSNYYVSPLCTPSRGTMFTGKYAANLGLQHYVIVANEAWGLPLREKTLPQHLKDLGYITHGIGKWHLGHFSSDYLPTRRGFDSFFGYWNGEKDYFNHFSQTSDMFGLDLHSNEDSTWQYNGFYSTELFTSKAKNVIVNHNSSKPLFLYLGYQAVHAGNSYSPLQVPPEYVKNFTGIKDQNRRRFAGIVSAFDSAVGDVFATLEHSRLLDNSLIVFTTDNGGAVEGVDGSTGSNWPLRGSKYTLWEGGVRGVSFIWSKSLREKSRIFKDLFHVSDWLPTIYSAAGGRAIDLGNIDGIDQWQALNGQKQRTTRDEILHNVDDVWGVASVRKGIFKLVNGSMRTSLDGWFDKQGKPERPGELRKREDNVENEVIYKKSMAAEILRNKFPAEYRGMKFKPRKVIVDCGERPQNYSVNCDPIKHPCLYNIQADPCEYNNIASENPQVVSHLEVILNQYKKKSIPPGNKPSDPRANPKYHEYTWVPWI